MCLLPFSKVREDCEKLLQRFVEVLAALVDELRIALLVHSVAEAGAHGVVDVQHAGVSGIRLHGQRSKEVPNFTTCDSKLDAVMVVLRSSIAFLSSFK